MPEWDDMLMAIEPKNKGGKTDEHIYKTTAADRRAGAVCV
jgi:hypothetical protein